ncbi:hypothetical protein ABZP36_029101 [Zizania latifolia]
MTDISLPAAEVSHFQSDLGPLNPHRNITRTCIQEHISRYYLSKVLQYVSGQLAMPFLHQKPPQVQHDSAKDGEGVEKNFCIWVSKNLQTYSIVSSSKEAAKAFRCLYPRYQTVVRSFWNQLVMAVVSNVENYTNGQSTAVQLLRPRLVAGKLLRRRLVSEFAGVAEDALLESCQSDTVKYRVFAGTWNVGGVAPPDDLDLEDWLDTKDDSYDIYVLGLQEIVSLNARNVLGPTKSSAAMKWNSLVRDALNKYTGRRREAEEGEAQAQQQFRCVVSEQMVGIFVSVWTRGGLRRHVRHAAASCVGAGVLGRLGNKGAVSVRFMLHGTSFCFVCCHLASGGKGGDALLRNADAADILSRTTFRRSAAASSSAAPSQEELPRKILDHDRVVLLGDLNYRIAMDDAKARLLMQAKKWSMLLENDELLLELSKGGRFEGWREGLVTFSPTYKYHRNSDMFYWCIDGGAAITTAGGRDKQQRAPAWCDRILWRGKGLRQVRYERCGGYRLSDHRPVRAVFHAVCEVAGGVQVRNTPAA